MSKKVPCDGELKSLRLELNEDNLMGISGNFIEDKDYIAEE